MKVLLTDNAHLFKTPDGKYYTPSIYRYSFFEPYLEVFDEVRFVSRTKYVDTIDTDNYLLVSGEGLEIYELPWYQGVRGIVNNFIELVKRYRKASDGCDCSIMRVSQMESYLTYFLGQVKNKPFALEVVNDPSTLNVGPKIINYLNKKIMKIMIKKANGVSYVTENYLQDLYPSNSHFKGESPEFFHSHYTDVDLLQNDILKKPRTYNNNFNDFKIIHIANSISGELKGHRTLIQATKNVIDAGYNVTVTFIGDGDSVKEFKDLSKILGIQENILFIGKLSSKNEVMNALDANDIFIFPSHTEGLPRVILEAQARGLPCLATFVGGIPELLDDKYLFKPEDHLDLSEKIIFLIENPKVMETMSKENIMKSTNYTKELMSNRRNLFYKKLKKLTK